ncbi:MAG: DUF998 domain-containing protein [Methanobacteriota archaeon]
MESFFFQMAILQRMSYSREKVAGAIFFIAVTQFILGLSISEALYPGYSVHDKYISDLGIGPSSIIFNSSAVLLGLLSLVAVYFLRHNLRFKIVNRLLLLMAIGAIGVGVFTKDFTVAHGAVSSMAFFFGGLSAIASFKVLKKPLSLVSIILGAMTLGALALFSVGMMASGSLTSIEAIDSVFYLGLGPGGMERMIVYPLLIWLAGFAGYLVTEREL